MWRAARPLAIRQRELTFDRKSGHHLSTQAAAQEIGICMNAKLRKLAREPKAFFRDALIKRFPALRLRPRIRAARKSGKPTAILLGFSDWKMWMHDVLPDYHVVFIGHSPVIDPRLIDKIPNFPRPHVFGWSYKFPQRARDVCTDAGIPLTLIEDGFVRSVGLGTQKSRPMSLVFDTRAMHFDRGKVSDLDDLLNTYDFAADADVMAAADAVMSALQSGLTKYILDHNSRSVVDTLGLDPDRRRILVLGQVEDDLSIKYGIDGFMSGNDLVRKVAAENPEATILYRPHPESIAVSKPHYSDPVDVNDICHVLGSEWALKDCFDAAHEAHVITSLAGLEAKVAGLDVHVYGMPFYSGWGFTIDHGISDIPDKRRRSLTLREVIAGAYVLYPRYYHPLTSDPIDVWEALRITQQMRLNLAETTKPA